ncbi:MAG: ECF transporter S component [Defluviitaleaceae bacterium]|nr:ECF transporter S component [Defluviitaleaceae bacterium]
MSNLKRLIVTAMLIALCVVLPMAFHSIPRAGSIILPMHIPVLLAGLICGWKFGLLAGVLGPFLSASLTGMPPLGGVAELMMIELGIYGLVSGVVMHFIHTRRASFDLYISLIAAMLVGRVVAGIGQYAYFFSGMEGESYTWALWTASYFVTSLPGIVIQLAFVPSVVMALERERVIPLRYPLATGA